MAAHGATVGPPPTRCECLFRGGMLALQQMHRVLVLVGVAVAALALGGMTSAALEVGLSVEPARVHVGGQPQLSSARTGRTSATTAPVVVSSRPTSSIPSGSKQCLRPGVSSAFP